MARTTRVKVSRKTPQILNRLKDETGLKSHDEVIRELVSERKKLPRSMSGSNPKLRPFSIRDEAESHEL